MVSDNSDAEASPVDRDDLSFEEVDDLLSDPQIQILGALAYAADLADRGEKDNPGMTNRRIHIFSGVPRGSMNYHIIQMRDELGLVEEIGTKSSRGLPAKIHALTNFGKGYVSRGGTDVRETVDIRESVDRIEDQLDEIKNGSDHRRDERIENLERALGQAGDRISKLEKRVDSLEGS